VIIVTLSVAENCYCTALYKEYKENVTLGQCSAAVNVQLPVGHSVGISRRELWGVRSDPDAEGVEGHGNGKVVSPCPAHIGDLGSVVSSPSGVRGAAPAAGRKRVLVAFKL